MTLAARDKKQDSPTNMKALWATLHRSLEPKDRRQRLSFVLYGLHFGLLQSSLFFATQVYIAATFHAYFLVVLAWMCGVLLSLLGRVRASLPLLLALSLVAETSLVAFASWVAPSPLYYPLYFALAVVVGLPAGAFFKNFSTEHSPARLFFHENNGFVLGLALGTLLFLHWGVDGLVLVPLLSALAVWLASRQAWTVLALVLPALSLWLWQHDETAGALALALANMLAALAAMDEAKEKPTPPSQEPKTPARVARAMLAIAGANLVLLQFFITRSFSSILAASELSIMVVALAYFSGFSVGYAVAPQLSQRSLRWLALAMFGLHLLILTGVKILAGLMISAGLGLVALAGLLFVASFAASSLYSVLLPRLIDDGALSLPQAYAADLIGAIAGTVLMLFVTPRWPALSWPLYFGLLLALLALLHRGRRSFWPVVVAGAEIVVALAIYQGALSTTVTEDYLRSRGYRHPRLLFAGHSPYHSIEIIETHDDTARTRPRQRISFINGVRYFTYKLNRDRERQAEASLNEFTYFLAELPAHYQAQRLKRGLKILILGGGSLSTLARVDPYAAETTLVEIDPLVVSSSKRWWAKVNRWQQARKARIVIDDARHFLRSSQERYDLIINDVSAPYYLGTAIMHSRELYRLVASRLAPEGLFAESTQGRPRPAAVDSNALKILRGVADVFAHWRVVDCHGPPRGRRGFVYASQASILSTANLTDLLKTDDRYTGTSTYWERSEHFDLSQVQALSLHSMRHLLKANIHRIRNRIVRDEPPGLAQVLANAFNPNHPRHSQVLLSLTTLPRQPMLWLALLPVLLATVLAWRKTPPSN